MISIHILFSHIIHCLCSGVTIIGNPHHRAVTGAVITERDLQTLERCNRENIKSLEVSVPSILVIFVTCLFS